MTTVRFLDLQAQYAAIKPQVDAAIQGVVQSGSFILGPETAAFEMDFADACAAAEAVGVDSGTSALELILRAADVGPGDEVITTPLTFVATIAAIEYVGARPVLADVEADTLTLDPVAVAAAITPRTRAILPVHLHGQMADMDRLSAIATRHHLLLIEDACQAHLAELHGQRAGSFGIAAAFSFYPGKNLGAFGDGGAVTTRDRDLARRIRLLRDWGAESKYEHVVRGYNRRLDEIQAAVLRVKLRYLEEWTEARRAHAAAYGVLLTERGLQLPVERAGSRHVYHVYGVRSPNRTGLQKQLSAAGVQTGIHYPRPVHLLESHRDLGYRQGAFPIAEAAAEQLLSLPMYPELTAAHLELVAAAVRPLAGVA